jgi:hypothetical protein
VGCRRSVCGCRAGSGQNVEGIGKNRASRAAFAHAPEVPGWGTIGELNRPRGQRGSNRAHELKPAGLDRPNLDTQLSPKRIILVAGILACGLCFGQFRSRPGSDNRFGPSDNFVRIEGGQVINEDEVRTARETDSHATGTANWTNAPGFNGDSFVFARVIFKSEAGVSRRGGLRWLGWWVDYPDADLNLSYRLQQITSIKTDPDGRVLKLTDPALTDYPLLYMEHAGYMRLSDGEVVLLRNYLLNGGAMLVNDFWGGEEWDGFAREMKRVLPGQTWTNLTTDHPLFHCVFDLRVPMNRLQVPTLQFWNPAHDPDDPNSPPLQGIYRGEGSEEMHVRALLDDQQRISVLAIHNSDISDGWEREEQNEQYFRMFSEKVAYPLAINIVVYLMTH